jgi:CelD/BcsL family acetyltransferase involved in cellulose biosynthesis
MSTRRPSTLEVSVVSSLRDLEALRPEWDDLLERALVKTPFLTWEWHFHWWQAFGARQQMAVHVVRDRGDLVGVAPFMRHRKGMRGCWLREVRFADVGGIVTPYTDIVLDADRAEPCVRALLRAIIREGGWDRLTLRGLAEDSPTVRLLQDAARQNGLSASVVPLAWGRWISLPETFDYYLAELGPNTRADIRRKRNGLVRRHQVEIRQCHTVEEVTQCWPLFVDLVRDRWRDKGEPTLFDDPAHVSFIANVTAALARKGQARLWCLSLDGEVVAMLLALVSGDECYSWYHGFRAAFSCHSPGILVTAYCIEDCIKNQRFRRIDFLRGEQEYKQRLAKSRRLTVTLCVHSTTLRSRVYRCLSGLLRDRRPEQPDDSLVTSGP